MLVSLTTRVAVSTEPQARNTFTSSVNFTVSSKRFCLNNSFSSTMSSPADMQMPEASLRPGPPPDDCAEAGNHSCRSSDARHPAIEIHADIYPWPSSAKDRCPVFARRAAATDNSLHRSDFHNDGPVTQRHRFKIIAGLMHLLGQLSRRDVVFLHGRGGAPAADLRFCFVRQFVNVLRHKWLFLFLFCHYFLACCAPDCMKVL